MDKIKALGFFIMTISCIFYIVRLYKSGRKNNNNKKN